MKRFIVAFVAFAALMPGTPKAQSAPIRSCPQYEKALRLYFPVAVVPVLSRVAWRESRCNPGSISAVRSTGYPDVGLLMVQGSWRTVTIAICKPKGSHIKALTNLACNLRVARYLYDHGGLGHWRATSGQ